MKKLEMEIFKKMRKANDRFALEKANKQRKESLAKMRQSYER